MNMAGNRTNANLSKLSAASFSAENVTLPAILYLPIFSISPEEIFQGTILLFNVDFFSTPKTIWAKGKDKDDNVVTEKSDVYGTEDSKIVKLVNFFYKDGDKEVITSKQDMASELQETIARWYVGIRNIVLVGMMIVLLYIGIRMMLATIASDKAKYKQLLQDWFVGLLLVFFIHYIMAFSVTLVQKLTDVVSSSVDKNAYAVKFPVDENGKIVKWFNENDMTYMVYDENGNIQKQQIEKITQIETKENAGKIILKEPTTQMSMEINNNNISTLTNNKISLTIKMDDTNTRGIGKGLQEKDVEEIIRRFGRKKDFKEVER